MDQYYSYLQSPIGLIEISATATGITAVTFLDIPRETYRSNGLTDVANRQLAAYFAGEQTDFDLPLQPEGTPFQQQVWQTLQTIPHGRMSNYLAIANQLNNPKAVRAVGAANGRNPIAILIPCHRVVGKNGKLVGYAGGLHRKEWLLKHEGALLL